jgi:competence protein ComEA
LALGAFVVLLFVVMVVEWYRRRPEGLAWTSPPAQSASTFPNSPSIVAGRFDLNQASAETLTALPGIGPKLAERIVAYREVHGPFRRVEDLRSVPGIGPKTFEKIRDLVYVQSSDHQTQFASQERPDAASARAGSSRVGRANAARGSEEFKPALYLPTTSRSPEASPSQSAGASARQNGSASRKQLPSQPLDINSASREDLLRLPGIGPVLAERILTEREQHGPFSSVEDLRRVRGIGPRTLEKLRPYVFVATPSTAGLH